AARACGGRPVPAHNLHTTVLFLGSVAESRVPDLVAIGARAAAVAPRGPGAAPPQLVFDRVEFWEKARVLVATASGTGEGSGPASMRAAPVPPVADAAASGLAIATALRENLLRETHRAGFAPDLKPFRAHVTVARKVARLTHSLHMHAVRWPLTGLALVES